MQPSTCQKELRVYDASSPLPLYPRCRILSLVVHCQVQREVFRLLIIRDPHRLIATKRPKVLCAQSMMITWAQHHLHSQDVLILPINYHVCQSHEPFPLVDEQLNHVILPNILPFFQRIFCMCDQMTWLSTHATRYVILDRENPSEQNSLSSVCRARATADPSLDPRLRLLDSPDTSISSDLTLAERVFRCAVRRGHARLPRLSRAGC